MKKGNIILQVCIFLLFLAASSFVFSGQAKAKEHIRAFDVTADLLEDASLRITESIRVTIEHEDIRHGIYRVLPKHQRMADGSTRYRAYKIESITFDGEKVDYSESIQSTHHSIAIGSEKYRAPLGEHVYTIRYSTTNHVLFLEERDEIFLNVTGNDWKFPIDAASFTFIVPGGLENILETTAFTGARGERGGDCVMEAKNVFRTTRPFAVGEGLTVAVAWKKGLVTLPPVFRIDLIADNEIACFLALFVLIALYCLVNRWRLHNHVPPVIPLFSAPEGMSPGYVAALWNKKHPGRVLQADIMGAAVNGFVRLDMEDAKSIVLHGQNPEKKPKEWIAQYCDRVVSTLLSPENPCDLSTLQGKTQAGEAYQSLKTAYESQQKGLWRNTALIQFTGWAATFLLACGMAMATDYEMVAAESKLNNITPLILLYSFGGMGCLISYFRRERTESRVGRGALFLLSGGVYFMGIAVLWVLMEDNIVACACQAGVFCAIAFFMRLLPNFSRTPKAMQPYAQLLGLEMYIRTAEKHRLAAINAPKDTVEKYEEILPYAIALDCAEAWQQRFDTLLRNIRYAPAWIQHDLAAGSGFDCMSTVSAIATTAAMAEVIDSCIAAHHTSSSDSGFDSGSSSGGGSGGGGGGGW